MTWKILRNILNKKNKINDLPKTFFGVDSSNEISDPKLIANKFNDYFVNIGPNLAKNIKDNAGISYEDYLTNKCSQSMFLTPVTEMELQTVIKNMCSNKSPGYDEINNKILKLSAKEISKLLTHIFNLSFESSFLKILVIRGM